MHWLLQLALWLVFQLLWSNDCKGSSILLPGSYLVVLATVMYLTLSEMIFTGCESLSIFNLNFYNVYKAIFGLAPAYINDLIIPSSWVINRPVLHSSSMTMVIHSPTPLHKVLWMFLCCCWSIRLESTSAVCSWFTNIACLLLET